MTAPPLTVWKRDRYDRAIGVECPDCQWRIELRDRLVTQIDDGVVLLVPCPGCRKSFDVDLNALGGYLWPLPK